MEKTAKRRRSRLERRQIVEETLQPGTSVSRVARAHDINSNQLFHWRKLYREGRLEPEPSNVLLPVRISASVEKRKPRVNGRAVSASGFIDIDLGHARVRIEGSADPACVKAALEGLLR
jgi:transposase